MAGLQLAQQAGGQVYRLDRVQAAPALPLLRGFWTAS